MDPGVIIGVLVGVGAILGGNIMEGGHTAALVGIPAFVIVIGGTIGAIIVQFPLPLIGAAIKATFGLFKKPPDQAANLVEECVNLAQLARKEGVLGLEKVAEQASHPLLKKGILMAVDGCDSEVIRSTLETAMAQEEEHTMNCARVWESAGGYSPTIGIIGAVLGLIHVMQNLTDIEAVGKGIATAFVATIYGVGAANLFFLPLGGRIKTLHLVAVRDGELILSGILAIQAGLNPKIVRERLVAYIESH